MIFDKFNIPLESGLFLEEDWGQFDIYVCF